MFPNAMTLDEVRGVVRAHNEALGTNVFIEADRGDHIIFNYMVAFEGVFPDYTGDPDEDRRVGILRECRGLIFDASTERVIARRFHKFFNLNQRPETDIGVIDWSRPHVIMEKLDGSMITPFMTSNGIRRWGTKMGATEVAVPVAQHVAARPEYDEFAAMCEAAGYTPLFEWCSRQQRIVIDYPEDRLVLLHLRNNETGVYATRHQIKELGANYGIPVVNVLEASIEDIHEFVEMTRGLKDAEGYVVQFVGEDGMDSLMLKLKAEQYCMLHNTKEKLNLEKNVLQMVLHDDVDDLLPQLDAGDRAAVTAFRDDIMLAAGRAAAEIAHHVELLKSGVHPDALADPREYRKQYAALVNGLVEVPHEFYRPMLFKGFDRSDFLNDVLKAIAGHLSSSTAVERIRPLIGGVHWKDYRGEFDGDA